LGAQAEASMTQAKFILAGYTVNDVLMRHYETISASDTVKTAVSMLLNGQTKTFLVTENEVPVGTVSRDEIILALSNKGENEIISRIMNNDLLFLDADTSLEKAYLQMQQHKSTLMPVMLDQKLIGTVDNENILEFLMVKNASTTKG
jgi:predicted transcriptional regulator